jgi:tetratricopeptide (TPR) repeat protein
MLVPRLTIVLAAWCLVLGSGWALARAPADDLMRLQAEGYDLLEAGKYGQAQAVFEKVLQQDPGNPLALNNLGALMVKQGRHRQALNYLEQALLRAKGYRVKVNRVCDVEGICLAFRPEPSVYGTQDLEPLIQLNLQLLKAKMAAGQKG